MIIAILQARMSSSRLPGKVIKPIVNRPMLALQVERIKRAEKIDKIILATSEDIQDISLVNLAKEINIDCFRGSLDNVLSRFYGAGLMYQPDHIVRLTGDCPLMDPILIDQIIEFHLKNNYDYTSNTLEPTFPDGLDIEIMKWKVLKEAYQQAELPSEKEHVTPFIYKHPERYNLGNYKNQNNYSHLRWTVDEQNDFELITLIYEALYPSNENFSYQDILEFIQKNPKLADYNTNHVRNEGMRLSLMRDQIQV